MPDQSRTQALGRSAARKWYSIKNAAADEAEVFIYDEIGYWGTTADQFVKDLSAVTASTIHVRINSPGGSVFDGLAIHNALERHRAKVVTHVDSLAASIASIIALAGDEVRMARGAFLMIHNAAAVCVGTAAEMREMAELLDKVSGTLVDIYAARTGKSEEEVRAWLAAETWFTAAEAKEAGFVDEVVDGPAAEARFDLSGFRRVPEALARGGQEPPQPPQTIREFESFLRDAGGYSRAAAQSIAAQGFRAASDPRDEDQAANRAAVERLIATLRPS